MANCDNLFKEFCDELCITNSKKDKMITSKNNLRDVIRREFKAKHDGYTPSFYTQGSYKLGTCIRTEDDKCDVDDGIYFKSNPDDVTGTTLQNWVLDAVNGVTDASPSHKKKCIRVNYTAGYNIDLPVMIFDKDTDKHPMLAVKGKDFQEDDPKEFTEYYRKKKKELGTEQISRMVKYLKAWCDHKKEDMPSGLAMTVLSLNHFMANDRDDVALKFLLIEIEKQIKEKFECKMPTTPYDNLFEGYSDTKERNFKYHLSKFIEDAKKAIDESNQLKASKLWKKHLGERFPDGKDEDEKKESASLLKPIVGTAKPYYNG